MIPVVFHMSQPLLIVFVTLIVLGLYDLGKVTLKGQPSTISSAMIWAGLTSPFWVFVTGVVMGHLVFGMRAVCP